ncbi:hypothetical protein PHK61_07945 [Actinomycetospora lutea]|uniref:hypothetical protein n=1 Tax=Actinomycetospora lutea TaxID=663604 RepID=UPI002366931D|nr:hypothetical protein [Actinomycetospora lutea]MDD7938348.1 hypothetical protein [Actinomycetospora lutea]
MHRREWSTMGHHRKGRPGRRQEPEPQTPAPHSTAPAPRGAGGVTGRGLDELADAARAARRTGWPFGAEVLATVDTRGVPATTPPPRDGKPRRYATHQPTAPLEVITESQVAGAREA